jgi:hypothetical protein
MSELNGFKVGDSVFYRRSTGYSEPGEITGFEDSIAIVKTEDFGTVRVHVFNNRKTSKDWIEKEFSN